MAATLLPPMPNWPSHVFSDEPAHAVFRRIAEANEQLSAATFAATMGLNGRNIRPTDFIGFCEQFPMAGTERLCESTPVVDGNWVHIRGQTLRLSSDISFLHPRICTACVAEQRYYRNWFDIWLISRCPFHDRPLVRGAESHLAWWHPPLTTTPTGESLEVAESTRLEDLPQTWERYVLGRMGLAEPFEVSMLDDAPLWQIGQAIEIVGVASLSGWTTQAVTRPAKFSPQRAAAISAGFNILKGGSDGIDLLLKKLASGRPDIDRFPKTGIHHVFGSFRESVRRIDQGGLAELFHSRMQAVAREIGIISRKNRPTVSPADGDQLTLNEAAKVLGVSPKKLRNVGVRSKIIPPVPNKNYRHWISDAQLADLKLTLADLITRTESMCLLAMTATEFEAFCRRFDLIPLTRLAGGGDHRDLFRRSTLIEKLHGSA